MPGLFNGMAIALSLIPVLAFAELAGALSQGWEGASLPVLGGAGGLLIIAFLLAPYLRKFGGYRASDGQASERPCRPEAEHKPSCRIRLFRKRWVTEVLP